MSIEERRKPEMKKPRRPGQGFYEQRHNHQEMNVMQNSTTVIDLRQFIEAKGGKPFTSSLNVAKAFDKQHHHVMQKLDALDCSDQFLTSNFSRVQFEHRGNQYDACEMTKDGFMFLVMGFTGKKAAAVKEGYIAAFNWMAEQLGSSGGEQVDSILRSTIGTDGFHMLGAVLDGKVRHLPAKARQRAKMHVWSQVHKAFSVVCAKDIPADKLDAARNFIGSYALPLVGEFLPKQEEPTAAPALQLEINFPVSRWLKDCPAFARAQEMEAPGRLLISPRMLYGMDFLSPTLRLLNDLARAGYNVEACKLETMAARDLVQRLSSDLCEIQRLCGVSLQQGIRFQVAKEVAA